ncbi:MAG: PIN domain-containing protein, partial [Steroidobacteraceae bacterium]
MSSRRPYGGAVLLADTSAWTHAHHPRLRDEWAAALVNGQIATCPIVELEILFSARDGTGFDAVAGDLAQLRNVPLTRSVTNAARQAMRDLAHVHDGYHRAVKIPDLLIAACAQDAAIAVLHYDEDFDRLAAVLEFES